MTRHMTSQVPSVKKSGVRNFYFFCLYTSIYASRPYHEDVLIKNDPTIPNIAPSRPQVCVCRGVNSNSTPQAIFGAPQRSLCSPPHPQPTSLQPWSPCLPKFDQGRTPFDIFAKPSILKGLHCISASIKYQSDVGSRPIRRADCRITNLFSKLKVALWKSNKGQMIKLDFQRQLKYQSH